MSPHLAPDRLVALARGLDPDDAEAEHLLDCPDCARVVEAGAEAGNGSANEAANANANVNEAGAGAALSRNLHTLSLPDPAMLARVEQRLVGELATRRRRFWQRRGVAVTLVVAAAAVWMFWLRPHPDATLASHATVVSESGQVTAVTRGDDEVLALRGEATFAVTKLPPGHRFRVRVGDDEVEVRGTRFRVRTGERGIDEVTVSEGVVEVRPAAGAAVAVRAGESWARPSSTPGALVSSSVPSVAPSAPSSAPEALPSSVPSSSASPGPGRPASAEPPIEQMQRGMSAFDAGSYAAASSLLDRAVAAEPGASWSRDARVLAGAARVMLASPDRIPSLGVGVAAFDAAAQRASRTGDSARASAARLGAARASSGDARRKRYCALQSGGPSGARAEIDRECRR